MRGRLAAERAAWELSLHTAWQGERLHRIEKLKAFGHYLKQARRPTGPRRPQKPAEMLATFQALASGGTPLKITRIR